MDTVEPIDVLNKRLSDYFGSAWNGLPIYRIVWSEDQFEQRRMDTTDSGIALLTPEVRTVPKYRQWIKEKWVLERLTVVPEINRVQLPCQISYEPLFVFMDKNNFPLPAKWEAAKFVIDTVNAAMGKESMYPKYVDPDLYDSPEARSQKLDNLAEELFGPPDDNTTEKLMLGQGIAVPSTYKKQHNGE